MSDVQDLAGQELHLEHSYRVVEAIHRGSMATLYAAEWHPLELPVVIRSWREVIRLRLRIKGAHRVTHDTRSRAALIRGPGLPDIVDVGEEDPSRPFVVMRLPPGALLLEKLQSEGRTLDDAACLQMVESVASALEAYRTNGLKHRGPTVDRVWAGDDGSFTLLGAGEVLYRDDTVTMHGVPTTYLLWHIPPEAFMASTRPGEEPGPARLNIGNLQGSELEDDPRAEVYTLGCLAYHALAGFHPFFVHVADTSGGIRTTMNGAPLELESRPQDSEVAQTIFRAMARDREQRFASPRHFAEALREAFAKESAIEGSAKPSEEPVWYGVDGEQPGAGRVSGTSEEDEAPAGAHRREGSPRAQDDQRDYRRATRIWQFATFLLTLAVVGLVGWDRVQPVSVVITTDPPAVELAERLGPVVEYRGRSPIILRQRQRTAPIELQVVGPDGAFGEAHRYVPSSSVGIQDLGRCVRLPLQLEFPHEE